MLNIRDSFNSFTVIRGVSKSTCRHLKLLKDFSFPLDFFSGFVTGSHVLGITDAFVRHQGVAPTFLLGGKIKIAGKRIPALIAAHSINPGSTKDIIIDKIEVNGVTYNNLVIPSSAFLVENTKTFISSETITKPREIPGEDSIELPFGVRLRDYQKQFMEVVINAIDYGKDRGYIVAPWQVGKTLCLVPLIVEAQKKQSGKKILIVSPSIIITETLIGDLNRNYAGTISIIDGNHKDYSGNIVVASAYTLSRFKHLNQINPDQYCMVVFDEANFACAQSWVRIATHFGFLKDGEIQKAEGIFLLGLTATPVRSDRRHLSQVFGRDSILSMRSVAWFIKNQYLHDIEGIKVTLREREKEEIGQEGEILVTAKNFKEFAEEVVDCYQNSLPGKKVLVYVARIEHVKILEEVFAKKFGEGYAVAVHSQMPNQKVWDAVDSYTCDKAKILISINKLSYGYRAYGTEGVIHTYYTNSWSRYAQRTGRALAIQNGEGQRIITILDIGWRGHQLYNPMSLPRLFGLSDYPAEGRLRPLEALKKRHAIQTRRTGIASVRSPLQLRMNYRAGLEKVEHALRFGSILHAILEEDYDYDILEMASRLSILPDELDQYLVGNLPVKRAKVADMAKSLGKRPNEFVSAWIDDRHEILSKLHPLPAEMSAEEANLVNLLRRALIVANVDSVASIVERRFYVLILSTLKGNSFPTTLTRYILLENLLARLDLSGLVKLPDIMKALILKHPEKKWQKELKGMFLDALDMELLPWKEDSLKKEDLIPEDIGLIPWEEAIKLREEFRCATNALALLRPRQQEVIRLYFFENMSYEEIAFQLGLNREHIRQIINRAIREIQVAIRQKQRRA